MLNKVRRNVSFNMVYPYQWFLRRISDGFCRCHSYKQGSYQSRAIGNSYRIYLFQRNSCF